MYKGKTFAILSLSGKIPVLNDWLMVMAKIGHSDGDILFIKYVDKLSKPELPFGAKILIVSATTFESTNEKEKLLVICFVKNVQKDFVG